MNSTPNPDLRASAREMHDAGLCVLPIKADGSKAPAVSGWLKHKVERTTPEQHDAWFRGRPGGIAVVYGAVSGGVMLIEFEGLAIAEGLLEEVTELAENSGLGAEWHALLGGWASESPSGGRHYRLRVEGGQPPPNAKLAQRLAREEEWDPEERQRVAEKPHIKILRTLIETRGEGGYGIVEPSSGTVHPTGRAWSRLAGGPGSIPEFDRDTVDALLQLCRMVDALPRDEKKAKTAPAPRRPLPEGAVRPGDDFEARTPWADIIGDEFDELYTRGSTTYWRRKGKPRGISATTGHAQDRDRLYVFTTSTVFDAETPYDKFAAHTLLTQGDTRAESFKKAATQLRREGFGSEPPRRRLEVAAGPTAEHFTDGSAALESDFAPEGDEALEGPGLRLVPTRPELDITNEADAIDGVLSGMKAGLCPDLYKRASGPCWVHQDDEGNPAVQQLGTDNLRAYMADHWNTYAIERDPLTEGTKEVRQLLMPKTCGTILGRKDWPLPHLRGIITSPVVRPDGSLLHAPGYDKTTGLYLQPRVPLRRLQPHVTAESVERAKDIILGQMLADFPWVKDSDRAHFLGALLTPILRPYFHGPTPLFIITATAPGSGKSLLKDILKAAYGIADTAWPENDTELRKSITTQLYTTGQPVVVLDNLPNGHIIKSPVLSAVLTQEHWSDRILGSTASVTMRNDRVWIVTGNGLRTGGDNKRRAMWVRLDPDCPDPDQRDGFRVGDLRPWLRQNTSTVVAALVTMVRSWIAAGARPVRVRKGDYSEWASILAGVLDHLGIPGWLADRDQIDEQDDETLEWVGFLSAWLEKLGTDAHPTSAILASLGEAVPRDPRTGEAPNANALGKWLKARNGRYFGDFKPVSVYDRKRCANSWRVEVHQRTAAGA